MIDHARHDPFAERARSATGSADIDTRYVLGPQIGRGGMGEVVAAHDRQLGRDVAIKRMLERHHSDEVTVTRFVREACVQARLDHPAVVPVYELGRDRSGALYFVMKRIAGTTLHELLRRESLATMRQRLLRAFADVCLAIEFAHTRGVIHRDLKPQNIILGDFGEVYVIDWGVAKILDDTDPGPFDDVSSDTEPTDLGAIVGTRGYMAPEQAVGSPYLDPRADIYSLGCMLFEILTGARVNELPGGPGGRDTEVTLPLDAQGANPAFRQVLHARSTVGPELEELCCAAVAADPADRLSSARALAEGVQRFLDGDRDLERRRSLAGDHLANALRELESTDDSQRRATAMREAGAALALDPNRADAAELIGKLMIEPPPAEVEQALEAEQSSRVRGNAIASGATMLLLVGFSLFLYAYTDASTVALVLLDVIALGYVVFNFSAKRFTSLARVAPINAILVGGIVAMLAYLYSPLLLAPPAAVLVASTAQFMMQPRQRWFVIYLVAIMLVAVLGPFAAEQLGWLPQSIVFAQDGLRLTAPALTASTTATVGMVAFSVVFNVTFGGWLGNRMFASEGAARRQLHVQAWHLGQLVRNARTA